ncbi:hypothetical protein BDN71DRAFT_1512853 [Pleurotus eryngii]|uniref:Uncharacterized protein n=1 Tax=Pleurotus eryngii TaxID=5323 RepID=A0A9P6D9G2_PLEER|nr:hypothetical protein BDN71DRAFT_1512853 [Pleurotus eryngii]
MVDSQIYAKPLLVKRHGYPLWVPEPYGHSAIYRTKGVRIGDVGCITPEGAFQTLFNIRAPPDHPVNRRGVPEGFEQIHFDVDDIDCVPNFHPLNSTITSSFAGKRSLDVARSSPEALRTEDASGSQRYTWASTEGAILHLPKGASHIDTAKGKLKFREQAMCHAKNWYKFAFTCSDASNDSLYLITGCDKTRSWMIGAFSSDSDKPQTSIQLSPLAGIPEGQPSYSYLWWSANSAPSYCVGPFNDETIASNEDPKALAWDDAVFATDAPQGSNQCNFIRGYKIMLRRKVLRSLLGGPSSTLHGILSLIKNVAKRCIQRNTLSNDTTSYRDCWPFAFDKVSLIPDPSDSEDCHPSTLINNFLLKKYPNTKVAITHDDDWIDLINEKDRSWPTNNELLARLRRLHSFHYFQNVIFPVGKVIRLENGNKFLSDVDQQAYSPGRALLHWCTSSLGLSSHAGPKQREPGAPRMPEYANGSHGNLPK